VRQVDADVLGSLDSATRSQALLDSDSGASTSAVAYIKTPPGGGSLEGPHVHDVDQVFFVLGVVRVGSGSI
jgi:hypothetical protein